ncbi:hypothetical protein DFP72DRAFT_421643 [Ephemerocybe angulata]|uniref:Uncharacterized protein n=1 Tax=Ephemerocybe angulata TaxID=980116 RepID=A0A8H6IF04_9AGAR|nr:hypothetical protein DFP72DRAFT_421643 [Tulosesus angulatus]
MQTLPCLLHYLHLRLCMYSDAFPTLPPNILLLWRLLGGISTSILFSASESWLVSSPASPGIPSRRFYHHGPRNAHKRLVEAAAAGAVSNQLGGRLVRRSCHCECRLAWIVIRGTWAENWGAVVGRRMWRLPGSQVARGAGYRQARP